MKIFLAIFVVALCALSVECHTFSMSATGGFDLNSIIEAKKQILQFKQNMFNNLISNVAAKMDKISEQFSNLSKPTSTSSSSGSISLSVKPDCNQNVPPPPPPPAVNCCQQ